MSRALWFVAGAGAGVYAAARARRAAEVLTPDGLADRLAGLSVGLRLFREEVLAGAAEKDSDVRMRLGLAADRRGAPDRPALDRPVDCREAAGSGGAEDLTTRDLTTRESTH